MKSRKLITISAILISILIAVVAIFYFTGNLQEAKQLTEPNNFTKIDISPLVWNGKVKLTETEKQFLENYILEAEHYDYRTEEWTKLETKIPENVYLAAKKAERLSGVPKELILAVCWTENPEFSPRVTSWSGKPSLCRIWDPAFNIAKSHPMAKIENTEDNIFASTNYMIIIKLPQNSSTEKGFVKAFCEPPVWNASCDQAQNAYWVMQEFKVAFTAAGIN